jgi:hypothetical protein
MVGIDVQGLYNWLSKVGFGGLLFFILVGFYFRWWAFGREIEERDARIVELAKDRDEWRERYLVAVRMATRSVVVASDVVGEAAGTA